MSSAVQNLFEAAETRISQYPLTNKSTISDDRIKEIVNTTIKHAPSAFNVQSARAVILLKKDHEQLWDIADKILKRTMPDEVYQKLARSVAGYKSGYGSICWFEDQSALDVLKAKNPAIQHVVSEWSDHSNGMHQYLVWTALTLEGLGANLQHYNYMPDFEKEVKETWNLPEEWKLKAQLVFGTPQDGLKRRRERTHLPLEERVKIFGN